MAREKTSPDMRDLLAAAVAGIACQKKMAFGYPVYFVNDNMFTGLHGNNIFLRLSEQDRETILSAFEGASPFAPNPGMTMKEYVVVPDSLYNNPEVFNDWLERSFAYMASLPPKKAKSKKKA
ncbi:MAG: TfoX/Sxy family protein [Dehalococcoidia bacterium]|nr:TfoX/Sxy family protein [Dehalococcoidia bacterium]